MPASALGLPEPDRERWREVYRKTPYQDLPWYSERPFPWIAEAIAEGWILQGARVLDIGCGAGTNALFLARSHFRVSGIDLAPDAIAAARLRATRLGVSIDLRVGDALQLPFSRARFGGAIDVGCFHTLPIPLRGRYARELSRVIRPGGRLVLAWAAREYTSPQGPPHRPSVEEVAEALEGSFQFQRVAFLPGRRGRLASYGAVLQRRVGRQPPLR